MFAVLYRFKLAPDTEPAFRDAWRAAKGKGEMPAWFVRGVKGTTAGAEGAS
jgi:heme-degrading monooxygenase HmoA